MGRIGRPCSTCKKNKSVSTHGYCRKCWQIRTRAYAQSQELTCVNCGSTEFTRKTNMKKMAKMLRSDVSRESK